MLDFVSSEGTSWATRNAQVLAIFAPLLLLTGTLGFLLPPEMALLSGAVPYAVFHLLAGAVGLAIVAWRSSAGAVAFNLVFGAVDLWQAVAGVTGLFPARLFALRPADHVVHVLVGLFLLGVGYLGKRSAA
jgi:hypothetical protein